MSWEMMMMIRMGRWKFLVVEKRDNRLVGVVEGNDVINNSNSNRITRWLNCWTATVTTMMS